jgi:L-seryl-tRNA(Ser) seleniumtransferase
VATEAAIGGGSAPGETLPSWAVAAPRLGAPDAVAAQLRRWRTPIVGRIAEERVLLDLRTVDPALDEELIGALRALCTL